MRRGPPVELITLTTEESNRLLKLSGRDEHRPLAPFILPINSPILRRSPNSIRIHLIYIAIH